MTGAEVLGGLVVSCILIALAVAVVAVLLYSLASKYTKKQPSLVGVQVIDIVPEEGHLTLHTVRHSIVIEPQPGWSYDDMLAVPSLKHWFYPATITDIRGRSEEEGQLDYILEFDSGNDITLSYRRRPTEDEGAPLIRYS